MTQEQAIGTARIDVVVDTSQFDVAVSRAKNRTAEMSNAAQQEYAKLDRAEKRRVDRLLDQANKLNLSKEQQLAYDAALRTHGTLLDDITRKIARNTAEQNANGLSAKQTAAALRGVPAQITDIFTSLQGGQNPMTVLLQQGGQLKDMFGGVAPAARALGSSLLGMVNPATLSAAALAGLVAVVHSGQSEIYELNKALVMTGSSSGKTVDDLRKMARELDGLGSVTRGGAIEALKATAAAGRFTGEQFDLVAEAAARMEASTGQKVDATIDKFKEIAKDPVEALLKLNETEDFLSQAQIDRIQHLIEEGDKQGAVNVAILTYADNLEYVAEKSEAMKPALTRLWDDMKDGAEGLAAAVYDVVEGLEKAVKNAQTATGNQIVIGGSGFGAPIGTGFGGAAKPIKANLFADVVATVSDTTPIVDSTVEREKIKAEEDARKEAERKAKSAATKARNEAERAAKKAAEDARRYAEQRQGIDGASMFFDNLGGITGAQSFMSDPATAFGSTGFESLSKFMPEATRQIADFGGSFDTVLANAAEGLATVETTGEKTFSSLTVFGEEAGRNIQRAFADFLFDPFAEGADGMAESFAKTLQRMAAEWASSELLRALGEWGKGNSGDGGWVGAIAGIVSSMFGGGATANAKGGVYSSSSLSAYSGQVVNKPTLFAFAKGAGLMGEAGPEAIMPLRRGAGGRLGVEVVGGRGDVNVTVEIENRGGAIGVESQQTQRMADGSVLVRLITSTVDNAMAAGKFDRTAGQAWGVQRKGMTRG